MPTCTIGAKLGRLKHRGKDKRTHDELAGVCKEQLANLETLWPEIGVESSRELVVAHGPLRCRSTKVIRGCLSDRVNV
jgi:hypothetical protein